MSNNLTLINQFITEFQAFLKPITPQLLPVLRQLVNYQFPAEVFALHFEIFSDGFTSAFPVRLFFLDKSNTEYFLFDENGKAQYPSPVDPGLLQLPYVYPDEFEEKYQKLFEEKSQELNEEIDWWGLAITETSIWLLTCWEEAGGDICPLVVVASRHDSELELDFKTKTWQLTGSHFE